MEPSARHDVGVGGVLVVYGAGGRAARFGRLDTPFILWRGQQIDPYAVAPVPPGHCLDLQVQRDERRRFPWGLGWLYRYGRDPDLERSSPTAFDYYLRSPLLSGLFDHRGCPRGTAGPTEEGCALVTLQAGQEQSVTLEVPLPQLDARGARRLLVALRERLDRAETITLVTTDGEDFELLPGSVRDLDVKSCRA